MTLEGLHVSDGKFEAFSGSEALLAQALVDMAEMGLARIWKLKRTQLVSSDNNFVLYSATPIIEEQVKTNLYEP